MRESDIRACIGGKGIGASAATGDLVVITGGVPIGTAGTTNLLKAQKV